MLTEPSPQPEDEEQETSGSSDSYSGRLLLTAALLAVCLAGHWVDLPRVHADRLPFAPTVPMTLLGLGLGPLMTGFLLVELFSLATAPGRRLRTGGLAGRARLNRAALITSLVTSGVQALGMAIFLENASSSSFEPVVDEPGWPFRLLLVATLAAVTAALFALGNLLSDYGIGNGFALLILANLGWTVWQEGVAVRSELAEDTLPPAVGIFVAVGLVALLVRYIRSAETTRTPPLPQGILPAAWAITILGIPWILNVLGDRLLFGNFDVAFLGALLVAIPLLSWLTFRLFSSRPRLEANLPVAAEEVHGIADVLERRLNPSMALLALGTVALFTWNAWQPHSMLTTWLTFVDLVIAVIIGLDLWDQHRFLRRQGAVARLVQLDNVHLSYRLAARLHEAGIDALARAQRFRSLYFFLGALIKIDILVPEDQLDRAREVWAELEAAPQLIV